MSYIFAEKIKLELDGEEASDLGWAIKHHLELMIDTHWKNHPTEFVKREGKMITICKELLASTGTYHVAQSLDDELAKRIKEKGATTTN